jgi:putative beta-barrel porin BBP2
MGRHKRLLLPCSRAAVVTIFLIAACDGAALGQERRDKPKYGTFRLGPFYLVPRLAFTAGVDSNVYNTPTGTSDEAVAVTPNLQAVLPITRRARIKGTGGIVPYYFHKEAKERHTDLFGQVLAEVDVGPLSVFGGVGSGKFRQRFSLEIDERLLRHEKNDVVGGTFRFGHRVSTTASQTTTRYTFDPEAQLNGEPVNVALDRDSMVRRLEFSLPVTRKTSLVPWIDAVEDRFLRSFAGSPRRVRSQRYALALDFGELAFLTGRVAVGVRHYGVREGVPPYDGLFLAVNASMPFVLQTRLQVSSNRDVVYAATPTAEPTVVRNTYVNSVHRAELLFELPLQLHGRTSVGYAEARYLVPTGTDALSAPRRDHAWTLGAALLRRFGTHLSLGGLMERANRKSPVDQHSYQAVRYLFTGELR